MTVIQVTDQDFEDQVLKVDQPVMVDFYADWCGPCQAAAPVIEALAAEYQGQLAVVKLNVDADPGAATRYQVMSIPTVIFFKNGREVARLIGFAGKEKYAEAIKKLI